MLNHSLLSVLDSETHKEWELQTATDRLHKHGHKKMAAALQSPAAVLFPLLLGVGVV